MLIACSSNGSNVVVTYRVEVGDLRELAQRVWRREVRFAENAPQPRVGLLAAAARRQEPADDVVQRVRLRELRDIDVELARELLCKPIVKFGAAPTRFRPLAAPDRGSE